MCGRARLGWEGWFAYVLVPLLTGGWVIFRAFAGDGILPINQGDEAAETFVQVPLVHRQLAEGDILKINLFNNFGTPLLGDPVTYPFALHAWSYLLFRPAIAMLFNKFLLAALSMVVLTLFFSRYFPLLICSFCAFLAFSNPAFFYFFQNHPHQGGLFYWILVLVAVRAFLDQPASARGCWLYATWLLFFLGVGVNGALLGTVFAALYAALLAGRRWKLLAWGLAFTLAAFVAVYPHFFEFFRWAGESARKNFDYQSLTAVPRWSVIKALFVGGNKVIQAEMYYSWPVMVLLMVGLGLIACRGHEKPTSKVIKAPGPSRDRRAVASPEQEGGSAPTEERRSELLKLTILLGLLPGSAVFFFRLFPRLATAVPLLKATNVSRVLWFSDVFLLLAAGWAVHAIHKAIRRYPAGYRALGILLLVASLVPRGLAFHAQANCFLLTETGSQFQPLEFLNCMQRSTRLATLFDPVPWSHDTKANGHGILGSGGRSIILQGAFRDYLARRQLIRLGFHGMTYFFVPAPPEVLARFGIRYCLSGDRDNRLAQCGWNLVADVLDPSGQVFLGLYENPAPVTPVYIDTGTRLEFLQHYRISGNRIEVDLPPRSSPCRVVATFLARHGWKAFIGGESVPIETSEEFFIRLQVPSAREARTLLLKYEPYSNAWLLGCVAVSLGGAIGLCRLLPRRPGVGPVPPPPAPSGPATGGSR
jgi:hypothetical protein